MTSLHCTLCLALCGCVSSDHRCFCEFTGPVEHANRPSIAAEVHVILNSLEILCVRGLETASQRVNTGLHSLTTCCMNFHCGLIMVVNGDNGARNICNLLFLLFSDGNLRKNPLSVHNPAYRKAIGGEECHPTGTSKWQHQGMAKV